MTSVVRLQIWSRETPPSRPYWRVISTPAYGSVQKVPVRIPQRSFFNPWRRLLLNRSPSYIPTYSEGYKHRVGLWQRRPPFRLMSPRRLQIPLVRDAIVVVRTAISRSKVTVNVVNSQARQMSHPIRHRLALRTPLLKSHRIKAMRIETIGNNRVEIAIHALCNPIQPIKRILKNFMDYRKFRLYH